MEAEAAAGTTSRTLLGGSLPVPNVQALAAASDTLANIPERYVRPEIAAEVVLDGVGEDEIPVVDFSRLLDVGFSPEEAAKLKMACEDWGFFQLTNHGVPEEVIGEMKAAVEGFFRRPLEEKMASSAQPAGSVEGYGQAFVVSEEQKLDWSDMLFLYTQPPTLRNPGLWPTHPPNFRVTLERYSFELKKVVHHLVRVMAKNLGLSLEPTEKLTSLFEDGHQSVRMNYYPPCPQHASQVLLGISPHSDAVGLTLLLQVNQEQGLQIRRRGGWIPVRPLPNAFVVNIGDIVEILTNGRYKSIEHRAMVNPQRERLSIAAFHSPGVDASIALKI